jgi:hypothetical protein
VPYFPTFGECLSFLVLVLFLLPLPAGTSAIYYCTIFPARNQLAEGANDLWGGLQAQ